MIGNVGADFSIAFCTHAMDNDGMAAACMQLSR